MLEIEKLKLQERNEIEAKRIATELNRKKAIEDSVGLAINEVELFDFPGSVGNGLGGIKIVTPNHFPITADFLMGLGGLHLGNFVVCKSFQTFKKFHVSFSSALIEAERPPKLKPWWNFWK